MPLRLICRCLKRGRQFTKAIVAVQPDPRIVEAVERRTRNRLQAAMNRQALTVIYGTAQEMRDIGDDG